MLIGSTEGFGEQRDIPVSKWYELAMEFVMEKEKADTAKDMEAADAARVIGRIVSLLQDNGETRE